MVEEEDDLPPVSAGVRASTSEQPSLPAQTAEQPAAPAEPAKVTSATYTLEGETQQHSLTQRLQAAIDRVVSDVGQAMPEVPPLVHDVLQVYADGWRWLMKTLFPKPLTPAEGERTSSRPAVAVTARRAWRPLRTAANDRPTKLTADTAAMTLSVVNKLTLSRSAALCVLFPQPLFTLVKW